jgi:hypothetical protein
MKNRPEKRAKSEDNLRTGEKYFKKRVRSFSW